MPVDDAGKAAGAQQLRAAEAAAAIRRLEPHVGQPLVAEELDVGLRVLEVVARRARGRSARRAPSRPRASTSGSDAAAGGSSTGSSAHLPERRVGRIDDQPPQPILGVVGRRRRARIRFSRRCATSASACTRSSGGIWPASHADVVLRAPAPRASSSDRCCTVTFATRRLQRPVRLLHRRDRLHDRFAEPQLGALLVPLRDDVLLPRRRRSCGPAAAAARTRAGARLQARIEAADRAVRRRPRGVPRHAPRAGAPRHRWRTPVDENQSLHVHAAGRRAGVRRRRRVARARRASSRTPA